MAKKKPRKTGKVKAKLQKLRAPVTEKEVRSLKFGDKVLISGTIYAARDAAHKLFDKRPPFETQGAVLYYASPTPTKRGNVIGSIGPTTATRMDPYTPDLLKLGVKLTIGKGRRGEEVKEAMKKYKAAYLVVPGGAAALMTKYIRKANILAYPDLGAEAVLELDVVDFPAIVAIDCKGGDLFEQGRKKYAST